VASLEDFEREGTFEELVQHRWRFANDPASYMFSISLDSQHDGKACLQAHGQSGADTAYQTVAVIPNCKYRLTGWVRTQLEVPAATQAPSSADISGSDVQDAVPEIAPPALESTTPASPNVGACFAILNRDETSEIVTGTTEWKRITWEFTTGDETAVTIGCRLGMPDQVCNGTAWFDDLKLEKVE